MKKSLDTLQSETKYQGRIISLVEEKVAFHEGKISTHATVRHPGAVIILPKLDDQTLLLTSQYRHSLRRHILEFPAGTLEPGEKPEACAAREVIEETGHKAARLISLGEFFPTPGFCNEIQHGFCAEGLSPEAGVLDDDEIIEVRRMSVAEVEKAIADGEISDNKSIAMFFRARLRGLV